MLDTHERAAFMDAIATALTNNPPPVYPPGGTPAQPVPPPQRFVKFGDAMICTVCQIDARYCKGHAPQIATTAQDGQAQASLERRIKDCQAR